MHSPCRWTAGTVVPGDATDLDVVLRLPVTADALKVNPNGVFAWLQAVLLAEDERLARSRDP